MARRIGWKPILMGGVAGPKSQAERGPRRVCGSHREPLASARLPFWISRTLGRRGLRGLRSHADLEGLLHAGRDS
eukprot:13692285-Alexandrium_andersonii.AAC.1